MRLRITIPCLDEEGVNKTFAFYVEADYAPNMPFEVHSIQPPTIEIVEDEQPYLKGETIHGLQKH